MNIASVNQKTIAHVSVLLVLSILLLGCTQPQNQPQNTPTPTPEPSATPSPTATPEPTAMATASVQLNVSANAGIVKNNSNGNATLNVTSNATASANASRPEFNEWVESVNAYAKRAFNADRKLYESYPEIWNTGSDNGLQSYTLTLSKAHTHWTAQDGLEIVQGVNGTQNQAFIIRTAPISLGLSEAFIYSATMKCFKQFYELQLQLTDQQQNNTGGAYARSIFDIHRGDRVLAELVDACPA